MDRIQNCQEKFTKLFGGKPTQNEGNDPEFMRILQRFIFGEVSYTGSLDDRMRELITVARPLSASPKRSTPSPRWTKCLRQTALPFPSKAARR